MENENKFLNNFITIIVLVVMVIFWFVLPNIQQSKINEFKENIKTQSINSGNSKEIKTAESEVINSAEELVVNQKGWLGGFFLGEFFVLLEVVITLGGSVHLIRFCIKFIDEKYYRKQILIVLTIIFTLYSDFSMIKTYAEYNRDTSSSVNKLFDGLNTYQKNISNEYNFKH